MGSHHGRVEVFFLPADQALGSQLVGVVQDADPALLVEAQPWPVRDVQQGRDLRPNGYALILVTAASRGESDLAPALPELLAAGLLPVILCAGGAALPPWAQGLLCLDGMDALRRFFEKEREVIPGLDSITRNGMSQQRPLRSATRRELRLVACHCLDEPAFLAFTFEAGIARTDIGGGALDLQILRLLHVLDTPDRLDHFADWLELERTPCVQRELDRLRADVSGLGVQAVRTSPPQPAPRSVFISFHPADARWLHRLRAQLKPLEREGWVTCWDMTETPLGADRERLLNRAVEEARVAVLLVSADYLADPLIATQQLPRLLTAAASSGLVVISVLIAPCLLPASLQRYQPLSTRATLTELPRAESDRALTNLVLAIRQQLGQPLLQSSAVSV